MWLGLVDIIFAFAYDNRITEGENNVREREREREREGKAICIKNKIVFFLCKIHNFAFDQNVVV